MRKKEKKLAKFRVQKGSREKYPYY